jgi:hypothetical protein
MLPGSSGFTQGEIFGKTFVRTILEVVLPFLLKQVFLPVHLAVSPTY